MSTFVPKGMGWQPDLPDPRDYTFRHPEVLPLLRRLKPAPQKELPDEVDLRRDCEADYFTETEDQGLLNSSIVFAVLSMVEYFERRIHGRTFEPSKLFLYQVTRQRIAKNSRVLTDSGADLRTTLKTLIQFGVPPNDDWPYDINQFDREPTAFLYALSRRFSNLRYLRLDEPNVNGEATWATLKSFLAAGFPVVFGFPVPNSLSNDTNIPYRPDLDSPRGGQAVVAVGYKTNHFGRGQDALLIRNSWGSQWGDNGNGWLPAVYIHRQIARDFWTVVSEDWLESSELSIPKLIEVAEERMAE